MRGVLYKYIIWILLLILPIVVHQEKEYKVNYKYFVKTDCEEARIFLSLSKSVTKHDSINRELSKNHFKASLLTLIKVFKVLWDLRCLTGSCLICLVIPLDDRANDSLVSFSDGCYTSLKKRTRHPIHFITKNWQSYLFMIHMLHLDYLVHCNISLEDSGITRNFFIRTRDPIL